MVKIYQIVFLMINIQVQKTKFKKLIIFWIWNLMTNFCSLMTYDNWLGRDTHQKVIHYLINYLKDLIDY